VKRQSVTVGIFVGIAAYAAALLATRGEARTITWALGVAAACVLAAFTAWRYWHREM